PDLYRVVAEAQFVDPAVFQRYYQDFAASYRAGLLAAEQLGEIAPGDAEVRAWALMGISDMVGRRFALWDGQVSLRRLAEAAHALILDGLTPRRGWSAGFWGESLDLLRFWPPCALPSGYQR